MNTKQISPVSIATLFAGSFLGAGFLSGQELLQFFGVFGGYGLAGMVLTIAAFVLFTLLALRIAKRIGTTAFDRIIVWKEISWLRKVVSGVFLFFLFDVVVAMIAGSASLLHQTLGLPVVLGSVLVTALVMAVALTGTGGLLTALNLVVPLLVLVAVVIGAAAFVTLPAAPMRSQAVVPGNPLLSNWLCSALSYVSYNMVGSIPILVPLSADMAEEKVIRRGLALGAVLLTVISVFILLPMILYRPLVGEADLPMLALADRLGRPLGILYAAPLFCGMSTAALSGLFAVTARVRLQVPNLRMKRFTFLVCLLACLCSLLGFKNLVAIVYPICGYLGLFALAGILVHAVLLSRQKAPQS